MANEILLKLPHGYIFFFIIYPLYYVLLNDVTSPHDMYFVTSCKSDVFIVSGLYSNSSPCFKPATMKGQCWILKHMSNLIMFDKEVTSWSVAKVLLIHLVPGGDNYTPSKQLDAKQTPCWGLSTICSKYLLIIHPSINCNCLSVRGLWGGWSHFQLINYIKAEGNEKSGSRRQYPQQKKQGTNHLFKWLKQQ